MSGVTGQHLIGGQWIASSQSRGGFTAVNPATGQALSPTYHDASV